MIDGETIGQALTALAVIGNWISSHRKGKKRDPEMKAALNVALRAALEPIDKKVDAIAIGVEEAKADSHMCLAKIALFERARPIVGHQDDTGAGR